MTGATIFQKMFIGLGKFFGFFWSKKIWHISFTSVFIIIYLLEGITGSIQQGSIEPFWDSFLQRVVNVDNNLYESVNKAKADGGIQMPEDANWWEKTKTFISTYATILFSLWFMFWLWFIFYLIVKGSNTSAVFKNTSLALLIVAVLITLGNIVTILGTGEMAGRTVGEITLRIAPFKGVVNLFSGIPDLIHPVYSVVQSPSIQAVDVLL